MKPAGGLCVLLLVTACSTPSRAPAPEAAATPSSPTAVRTADYAKSSGRRLTLFAVNGTCLGRAHVVEQDERRVLVDAPAVECSAGSPGGSTVVVTLRAPVEGRAVTVGGYAVPVLAGCDGRLDETQQYDGCRDGAPPPP